MFGASFFAFVFFFFPSLASLVFPWLRIRSEWRIINNKMLGFSYELFSVFSILSVLNSWLISLFVCLFVRIIMSQHTWTSNMQTNRGNDKNGNSSRHSGLIRCLQNWSTDMYMQFMPLWFLFAGFLFKIILNTHSFSKKIVSYCYIVLVCACGQTKLLASIYNMELTKMKPTKNWLDRKEEIKNCGNYW